MGKSQESYQKKEVQNRKEKKRKDKEKKRVEKKEKGVKTGLDDMIAYVDENGMITSTLPDPKKKKQIAAEDIEIRIPPKDTSEKQDVIRKGTLISFFESRGFGFISDAETQERIFVHVNNMIDEISEGNAVTFEIENGHKGPVAVNVKKR
jgi:cold shock CspA family protein